MNGQQAWRIGVQTTIHILIVIECMARKICWCSARRKCNIDNMVQMIALEIWMVRRLEYDGLAC